MSYDKTACEIPKTLYLEKNQLEMRKIEKENFVEPKLEFKMNSAQNPFLDQNLKKTKSLSKSSSQTDSYSKSSSITKSPSNSQVSLKNISSSLGSSKSSILTDSSKFSGKSQKHKNLKSIKKKTYWDID